MLGFQPLSVQPISTIPLALEFQQVFQQGYRVAADALALYELYVGEDAPVDFSDSNQPVATSASLPFSWTPIPPASGVELALHIVVRKRNIYDLQSFNVYETILVIDSVGEAVPGPLATPQNVRVYDDISGYVRVISKYDSQEDSHPPDTWEIYVTEGADPVPGVDVPVYTGSMAFWGTESLVAQTVGAFTPGAVAHVIVTVLRTSDGTRKSAVAVLHTIAEPLDLTSGNLFGGTSFEQR